MAERVLIQCGDHWENQCRVLPLALAYQARGWEPVLLTYDAWQGALFVAHGLMVCPLHLSARRPAATYAAVDALRAQSWAWLPSAAGEAFREVLDVERRRSPGRFASWKKRQKLMRSVARQRAVLEQLLDEVRPRRVAIWNGLTGVVANWLRLLTAERGLDTDFLERGLLPDSVFIDPRGTNGDASLHLRTDLPELDAQGTRLPAVEESDAGPLKRAYAGDARVLFLPLQVQADTNLLFHNDRIQSMRHLVETVAAAAPSDAVVVVRGHPEETNRDLQLPSLPNVRYVSDGTVEQWCDAAALVVTVNSTVGLTALLRGRPVVALGRAIYTNKGLTTDVAPDQNLGPVLSDPRTYDPPPVEAVARYYQLLRDRHTAFAGGLNLAVPEVPSEGSTDAPRPQLDLQRRIETDASTAQMLARRWERTLQAARKLAVEKSVAVVARIQRRDTRNLTYRRRNEELTRDVLIAGVASILETSSDVVSLRKGDGPPEGWQGVCVVVQTQRCHDVPEGADIVVDQYLQPHVRWLAGQTSSDTPALPAPAS